MAYYAIKVKELEEDGRCYVAEVKEDGHLGMTYDPGTGLDRMGRWPDDVSDRQHCRKT